MYFYDLDLYIEDIIKMFADNSRISYELDGEADIIRLQEHIVSILVNWEEKMVYGI